jgi:chlorite dismutase
MPEVATFVGGTTGAWKIVSMDAITGPPLERVARLEIVGGRSVKPSLRSEWLLRGVTSNGRYTTRSEQDKLITRQPQLGRADATHAALIPIKKSFSWWHLSQDERRAIFETRSGHIRMSLKYLPAIARRLYHCRDLGEPFDFLTWFEYAPSSDTAFDRLVTNLRGTEEWTYIEREVDIRLIREHSP